MREQIAHEPAPEKAEAVDVHIRWLIRRDMAEVLDIERGCFNFPWTEKEFISCLRQRNCIGKVAEHNNQVVGYMLYELRKIKFNIVNFAVHPDFQRRGVGRLLIESRKKTLSPSRRTSMFAWVGERNLDAQLFFKACGFHCVCINSGRTVDNESSYGFEYRIDDCVFGLAPVEVPPNMGD